MRYIFLILLAVTAMLLTGFGQGPANSSLGPKTMLNGARELAGSELKSRVSAIPQDVRYEALRQVAQAHHLSLEPRRARGLAFPQGDRIIFISLVNSIGRESGFLASSAEGWSLSIETLEKNSTVFEGFVARLDGNGNAVVDSKSTHRLDSINTSSIPDNHHAERESVIFSPIAFGTASSCQYVRNYGINFGCVNLKSNPFGYYYTKVYRYGTTPDPRSPSWWACWQGSIHVCPRYESQGSPFVTVTCGFPPRHPAG
jgi:hypothetical protein